MYYIYYDDHDEYISNDNVDREQDRPNSLSAARTCETIIVALDARIVVRQFRVNANSGL